MYPKRFSVMKKAISNSDAEIIISTRTFLNEWLALYANPSVTKIGWEHNHHHNNEKYAVDVVRSSKNLDYFVLVSKELKKFYTKKLRKYPVKCVYIPNMLDKIPEKLSSLTEKRIVSIGRLSREKGFTDLIEVFRLLHEKKPDWHLDIVGDGAERNKVVDMIYGYRLTNNVTVHGYLNRKEIDKLLSESSLYVMTSYTESFGIVLIEAMSYGIPCLAYTSAEGANDLIVNDQNGYLIENRDPDLMVEKLIELIDDPKKRQYLGKNGRKTSLNYTPDRVKDSWHKLLKKKG